jgi:hypothetical protein
MNWISVLLINSLHDRLLVLRIVLWVSMWVDLRVRWCWWVSSNVGATYGSGLLLPHWTSMLWVESTWALLSLNYLLVPAIEIWWRSVCQIWFYLLNSHWWRLGSKFIKSVSLRVDLEPLMASILISRVCIYHFFEEWVLVLACAFDFAQMVHRWWVGYHLPRRVASNHTLGYTVAFRSLHVIRWIAKLYLI